MCKTNPLHKIIVYTLLHVHKQTKPLTKSVGFWKSSNRVGQVFNLSTGKQASLEWKKHEEWISRRGFYLFVDKKLN